MKRNLLKLIMDVSKRSLYLLIVQIVSMQFVLANEILGQSLVKVEVSISKKNASLEEIFSLIENQTDFVFVAKGSVVNSDARIDLNLKKSNLKYVLEALSREFRYNFKRVNKNIYVRKQGKAERILEEPVEYPLLDRIISGKVTDESGNELPGVNVLVKDTDIGTITDLEGNYTLNVPDDATMLVFSYVGYITEEIDIAGRTTVDFALTPDIETLSEVVVVGYGIQKKENLTGSISTVKLEDAQNRPITNASQALAGLAAGVNVSQNAGRPGADGATIRIRGVGTLGNSDPLVLIDGIVGQLGDVNVNDIETMTVLKDAASAAIYGSRAANGVILVTTKTGKTGDFKVNYDGYTGFQQATRLPDYVTNSVQFMELMNQAILNKDPNAAPEFTAAEIEEFRNGTDPFIYPNTDWVDLLYRTARITTHNLSVRGGGENTQYSFSVGYIDQEGIFLGTEGKQYTARLNLNTKVSNKFNYSLKIQGRHNDTDQPVTDARTGISDGAVQQDPIPQASTVIGWSERASPMHTPFIEDGRYGFPWIGFPNAGHPLAGALEGTNNLALDNLLVNLTGEYELVQGLKLRSTIGVQTTQTLQKVFRPSIDLVNPRTLAVTPLGVGGNPLSAWNRFRTQRDITLITTLTYNKTFADKHNLTALAGFQQEDNRFQSITASKDNLPSNELQEISAGSTDPMAEGRTIDFGLQSFFGRINYDYLGKYLFEANVRYDGSSNFGEGNKWGLFPSFSAGWNLARESFMEEIDFFDELKLRASWGQLGNQNIAPNQFATIYSLGQDYSYGGALVGGAAQTALANEDVTWETSTQIDFGLDMSAFAGRLSLTVDYYIKDTEDILRDVNISSVVGGLSPPTVNLASVRNKGWEFLVDYRNAIGDFSYNIGANLTTVDNEVTRLPTPQIGDFSRLEEGRPINEFYAIKMLGIFQNQAEIDAHGAQPDAIPGDIKFEDLDNNGIIDDGDRQSVGSSIPDILYGFNISMEYKNFDFSMIWQGVEGINARTEFEQLPFFNNASLPQFWLDNAWTPENPNNQYPRLLVSSDNNTGSQSFINSSFLVEDASFLRLKNIQLGYSLPDRVLEQIGLERFRIYVNATNPLTFTDYRGIDPEKDPFSARSTYSNVQIYSFGLNVSF